MKRALALTLFAIVCIHSAFAFADADVDLLDRAQRNALDRTMRDATANILESLSRHEYTEALQHLQQGLDDLKSVEDTMATMEDVEDHVDALEDTREEIHSIYQDNLSSNALRVRLKSTEDEFRDYWNSIEATLDPESDGAQIWKEIKQNLPYPIGADLRDDQLLEQLQYLIDANRIAVTLL